MGQSDWQRCHRLKPKVSEAIGVLVKTFLKRSAGSVSGWLSRNLLDSSCTALAGRMGRRIVAVAALDGIWNLVAAIERSSHPLTGEDSGLLAGTGSNKVTIASQWHEAADVIIDFSLPGAVAGIAAVAAEKKIPLVVATTGLGPVDRLAIESASTTIPVLESPSMSLAVNVALDLVARAGRLLAEVGGRCDVEILEWHHRHKEDAPSGTGACV